MESGTAMAPACGPVLGIGMNTSFCSLNGKWVDWEFFLTSGVSFHGGEALLELPAFQMFEIVNLG